VWHDEAVLVELPDGQEMLGTTDGRRDQVRPAQCRTRNRECGRNARSPVREVRPPGQGVRNHPPVQARRHLVRVVEQQVAAG